MNDIAGFDGSAVGDESDLSGVYIHLPFGKYRSANGLNASLCKAFAVSGLEGRLRAESDDDPTASMLLGRALHELIDARGKMDDRFVSVEAKGKATSATLAKHQAEHPDRVILAEGWGVDIRRMYDSIDSHATAGPLMRKMEHREVSIFWDDPDLKMRCKARLDAVLVPEGIVDVKTTSDDLTSAAIDRAILNYRYDIQAAWYLRGGGMTFRKMHRPGFAFIFVQNRPPYDCVVVGLDDETIMQGWADSIVGSERYKAWMEKGEALGVYPRGAMTCGLPKWARTGMQPSYPMWRDE